ncbi:hypothetical protein F4803DRAFT_258787 [Xylaria telfairii]|nr:hypothetical protein F4803DRAFT_258787 [Xylaria telfairii]
MDAAGLSISLAEIVLKLVVFSLDFVSDAKQVHKHGATDRNIDLSTVTKSVEDTTAMLAKQLGSSRDSQVLDADDELKQLSLRAAEIGRDLAQRLKRVTADDKSKWKSFKAAALGMWDASEIEKTEKSLNTIKDQIQFRILVDIRDKVNRSHDSNNSRRLSALEEVAKQQMGSKEDTKRMIEKLNNAEEIGRERHEELLRSISRSSNLNTFPQAPLEMHDQAAREAAKRSVLNSLWYSDIRSREENISEAYTDTFRWIFEDPKETGKPWDSFVDYLRGDTSTTYWITGKPGCGKSTLMKFINDSPKTQNLLEQWAGEREMIRASFYFYYGGGENQKSEIGLTRSLLYSILRQRCDLIPTAFETRYEDALEGRKCNDLSLPEAKRALRDLISRNPNIRFFISIDGLDEFDPAVSRTRVQSLIDLTRSLEEPGNVKILVASRPLPEFDLGYGGRPSLSVHHLTEEDIRRYANGKLLNHPTLEAMARKDPKSTRNLLQSIVERSLGVFLWVRVVTESLVEGLTNYDSIDDLRKRVDDLPSEIQDLYMTILNRIDPKYKQQTARLLFFVHYMNKKNQKLTLLDLWFSENADNELVRNTPVKPIEVDEIRDRVKQIQTLLKSRCLALVETVFFSVKRPIWEEIRRGSIIYDPSWNELNETTRFIHRSVNEFLDRDNIWEEIVEKHLSTSFSVALSLFRSVILVIKTYRSPSDDSWKNIPSLATLAGQRACSAEMETRQPHSDLLHELDVAMRGVMPLVYRCPKKWRYMWSNEACNLDPKHHWSAWCRNVELYWNGRGDRSYWPLLDNSHGSLMTFAVSCGLELYIESQIASKGRTVLAKAGLPLLGYALMSGFSRHLGTIKCLLNGECDPNEIYKGMTVWEWHLWMCPRSLERDHLGGFLDIIPILEAVLLAGANPNARMLLTRERSNYFPGASKFAWVPPSLSEAYSVCTILFILSKLHQFNRDSPYRCPELDEALQRVIRYLEERGAKKEEWEDKKSIMRIFRKINRRIDSKAYPPGGSSKGRRRRWRKRLRRRIKFFIRRWK